MKPTIKNIKTFISSISLILVGVFISATFANMPSNHGFFTQQDAIIQEPAIKSIIKLKGVAFKENTAIFKESAYPRLDVTVKALKKHSNISVVIAAHTSNAGSNKMNKILSNQRAKVVNDYLVQHGVNPMQLTHKGYGADLPITSNKTLTGRKLNERMELRVY